jgi:ParB-like chromosome segregation protein Spo0J
MGFKDICEQRARDIRYADPKQIKIKQGFNARLDFNAEKLEALAQSIFENGFYDSCAIECRMEDGELILVDGERRLKATFIAIKNGMTLEKGIPVMLVEAKTGEAEDVIKMLNKNQGGVPLTATEEANAIGRLVKWGWKAKKIAAHAGMTLSQVNGAIALLGVSPETMQAVEAETLAPSTAVKLKQLPAAKQKEMIEKATTENKKITVADVQKARTGRKAAIKTEDVEKMLEQARKVESTVTADFFLGQVSTLEEILRLAE